MDFFIWRRNYVSVTRCLEFFVFDKCRNFKKSMMLSIDMRALWKYAIVYKESKVVSQWDLVRYYCNLWQTILTCFCLYCEDRKIVPGSFMILVKCSFWSSQCSFKKKKKKKKKNNGQNICKKFLLIFVIL